MSLEKDRKKLKQLNKEIEKGAVKTSLHLALAITVGIGFSKFLIGEGIGWLLFSAWISFPTVFCMCLLFSFMRDQEMAAALLIEKLGGDDSDLARPPKSITGSVIVFLVIWGLLAMPVLFKTSLQSWAKNYVESSVVDVNISSEDGILTYLKIPRLYVQSKIAGDDIFSKMAWNVPGITIAAAYPDMEPFSLSGTYHKSDGDPSVTYYTTSSGKHPKHNRRSIIIDLKQYQTEMNQVLVDEIYEQIPFSLDGLNESMDYDLNIKSGEVLIEKNGRFEDVFVRVATPINFNEYQVLIACEETLCAMFTNVSGVSFVNIHFNADLLADWRRVYEKSEGLLLGFVEPVE